LSIIIKVDDEKETKEHMEKIQTQWLEKNKDILLSPQRNGLPIIPDLKMFASSTKAGFYC
jgi:hypothetical protein